MSATKAQQRATAKYEARAYDKTLIRLPKGHLDEIKAHAAARGESVNGFIGRAIDERMERNGGNIEGGASPLPMEVMQAARAAASATGETVPEFIFRAVEATDTLDKSSLSLGVDPVAAWKKEREKRQRRSELLSRMEAAPAGETGGSAAGE